MSQAQLLDLWRRGYPLSVVARGAGVSVLRIKDRLRILRGELGVESVPLRLPGNPAGRRARAVGAVRWSR